MGNSAKTLEQATKSFDMSTGSQQQAAAPPLFSRERLSAYIDPGLLILVALKEFVRLVAQTIFVQRKPAELYRNWSGIRDRAFSNFWQAVCGS